MKLFLAFSVLVAMAPGCKKDGCKSKSPQSEAAQLQAYATANGITPTVHSTGLYYEIIDEGTGAAPTATSKVVITYTGRFLDNQIFSQQTTPNNTAENPAWPLSDLIEGWRIGLPLIKKVVILNSSSLHLRLMAALVGEPYRAIHHCFLMFSLSTSSSRQPIPTVYEPCTFPGTRLFSCTFVL